VPQRHRSHRGCHRLLEGELGREVGDLLAHVDPDTDLGTQGARSLVADGQDADRAWRLLKRQDNVGCVTAGKLLARKRPRLIPVWDNVVRCAFGRPKRAWRWLDSILREKARRPPGSWRQAVTVSRCSPAAPTPSAPSPTSSAKEAKGGDGHARTREVKLAVFFTQDKTGKDGYPVRDPHSSSYLAYICGQSPGGDISRGAIVLAESTYSDGAVFSWCGGAFPYPFGDVGGPVAVGAAGPVYGGLDVDAEQAGQVLRGGRTPTGAGLPGVRRPVPAAWNSM
jgi:hypothetical protein